AGRHRALAVGALDRVPQRVAGLVAARLVRVVAVGDRDGAEFDGEFPPAGYGEYPRPVPAWRAGAVARGERPWAVPIPARRAGCPVRHAGGAAGPAGWRRARAACCLPGARAGGVPGGPGAALPDGPSRPVPARHAPPPL